MKKSKARNLNKKAKVKKQHLKDRMSIRATIVTLSVICVIMISAMLVLENLPAKAKKFRLTDEGYVDPDTAVTYVSAIPYVYEPFGVYYEEDDIYGTMDGDKVYRMENVSIDKWLAREIAQSTFIVYHEKGLTVPTLNEFGAKAIHVCRDDAVVTEVVRISADTDIKTVIKDYLNGEKIEKPEGIKDEYTLRFSSDSCNWLYYCVGYAVTENGGYYFSLDTYEYYAASSVIADALSGKTEE